MLTYHGLVTRELGRKHPQWATTASTKDFQSHLEWIPRWFTPVTLGAVLDWHVRAIPLPKHPILITFDDGYYNNAALAAPLLRRYGIPATFFITTSNIDTGELYWHDELTRRLLTWPLSHVLLPGNGTTVPWPQAKSDQRRLVLKIKQLCKQVHNEVRLQYLEYARRSTPNWMLEEAEQPMLRPMNWPEVRSLVEQGFDVGSHTVTHPILSQLDPSQLADELTVSKRVLESHTGRPCYALAYPNGTDSDITPSVLRHVQLAGYELAFSQMTERLHGRHGSRLMISRITAVGHAPLGTLRMRASGLRAMFDWKHRRRPAPAALAGSNEESWTISA